jgi:hypothetical protein
MPKARRDPNTPPKRAILAISRLRRPGQLLILTGDQEASRAGAIAYSTLLNCATPLYTSTKAVQPVAQQIRRANGRFELFSSLLTPRTFELRGQQTAESSGYK